MESYNSGCTCRIWPSNLLSAFATGQLPNNTNVADVFPYKHFFMQTVDQFFDLKVPMRPTELSGLFRGVDNAFQVFANHVIDKLGMCYL